MPCRPLFAAASFNPFKVGSVTPKPTRKKKHETQVAKRKQNYKRAINVEVGRLRRSIDCNESRRGRKERGMATRRSLPNRKSSTDDTVDEMKEKSHKEKLTSFYKKYNPTKLDEIDGMLTKYCGKEDDLFHRLVKKYNADPSLLGLGLGDGIDVLSSKLQAFTPKTKQGGTKTSFSFDTPSTKPHTFGSSTNFAFGGTSFVSRSSFTTFADTSNPSTKPPLFGSSGSSSGFGASKSSGFGSGLPKTPFPLFAKESNEKTGSAPIFGSKSSVFGNGFGTFSASKPVNLTNAWGQAGGIRAAASFDSEAMDDMECD